MINLNELVQNTPFITREHLKELESLPNLKRYIKEFGDYKGTDHIEKLTYFFKYLVNTYDLDIKDITGWDDDLINDFYSWGCNSRWFRFFEPDMANYPEFYIPKAIELANKYGDINVEEILKSFGEE